ncbi:DMT family transporter [Dehalobacter sp. DCM]|uniref:DMT family transporter n=1 Tax=Dehalobacter sp. DCM TaxID=2907827 RepID=UPI00308150DE|nr:DMT family transporter [Dehalobacter sp. DCM]
MKSKSNLLAYVLLIGAVALWGGNWVAARYIVQAMSPLAGATIRMVLSAIILVIVLKMTTGKLLSAKGIFTFIFLGLMLFGFNILQYTGLTYTTAINGSLINAATPMIIIILSRFIIKEKLSVIQILGVVISFLGVGWVITKGSWALITTLTFNIGDILMFLAATCWALYTIYSKNPTVQSSALYVTTYASLIATVYFLPFGIVQYQAHPLETVSWGLVVAIIYVICVAVFGLVFWGKGVSIIGPSRASVFMNFMPIFTLIFAFLLLNETVTPYQLLGGIFVIAGVYLTSNARFSVKSGNKNFR